MPPAALLGKPTLTLTSRAAVSLARLRKVLALGVLVGLGVCEGVGVGVRVTEGEREVDLEALGER